jgi:Lon protease-like protein
LWFRLEALVVEPPEVELADLMLITREAPTASAQDLELERAQEQTAALLMAALVLLLPLMEHRPDEAVEVQDANRLVGRVERLLTEAQQLQTQLRTKGEAEEEMLPQTEALESLSFVG